MWGGYFIIMSNTYGTFETFAIGLSELLEWTLFKPIELEGNDRVI